MRPRPGRANDWHPGDPAAPGASEVLDSEPRAVGPRVRRSPRQRSMANTSELISGGGAPAPAPASLKIPATCDVGAAGGKLFDRMEDVRRDAWAVVDREGWPVRENQNRDSEQKGTGGDAAHYEPAT